MGLNGLGVGQNCPFFPPPPSAQLPFAALGRSVVNLGVYFLEGFLGVSAVLDSVVVVLSAELFFLFLRVLVEREFFHQGKKSPNSV